MKKVIAAAFILLSSPLYASSPLSSLTIAQINEILRVENENRFAYALKKLRSQINKDLSKEAKIVIFGDPDHGDQNIKNLFFQLARWLYDHDNSFNCVFLEEDKRFQKSIDNFLNGMTFEKSISKAQKEIISQEHYPTLIRNTFLKSHSLKWARANKIRLFAYNISFGEGVLEKAFALKSKMNTSRHPKDIANYFDFVNYYRNKVMSQNINEHIQQHHCKRSIIIVGSGHMEEHNYFDLSPELFTYEDKTMGDYLSEMGLLYKYYVLAL